jgi:hypothetical protein
MNVLDDILKDDVDEEEADEVSKQLYGSKICPFCDSDTYLNSIMYSPNVD